MSLSRMGPHTFAWRVYQNLLSSSPIGTKAVTSAVFSYVGDLATQKFFDKVPVSQARALKLAIFSLLITPISHYWYRLLDDLFPRTEKAVSDVSFDDKEISYPNVAKKVIVDQVLYQPFVVLFFFVIVGILNRSSISGIKSRIGAEYWLTLRRQWNIWPWGQFVNFLMVPGRQRILFMNIFGFLWSFVIRLTSKTARLPIAL